MYAAFNVNISDIYKYYGKLQAGKVILEKQKNKIKNELSEYLVENKSIDGDRTMEEWFPSIDCDIFISHSHKNQDLALSLAGWIKDSFGLDCFVDSALWGDSDELLRIIDNKYCLNKVTNTYDYDTRNISTSHVHMMLVNSLMKMVDKTEAIFFLNTPDFMTLDKGMNYPYTYSPWLYTEYTIASYLPRKYAKDRRLQKSCKNEILLENRIPPFHIGYKVNLEKFPMINDIDLNNWKYEAGIGNRKCFDEYPLDSLYRMKKVNTMDVID